MLFCRSPSHQLRVHFRSIAHRVLHSPSHRLFDWQRTKSSVPSFLNRVVAGSNPVGEHHQHGRRILRRQRSSSGLIFGLIRTRSSAFTNVYINVATQVADVNITRRTIIPSPENRKSLVRLHPLPPRCRRSTSREFAIDVPSVELLFASPRLNLTRAPAAQHYARRCTPMHADAGPTSTRAPLGCLA